MGRGLYLWVRTGARGESDAAGGVPERVAWREVTLVEGRTSTAVLGL